MTPDPKASLIQFLRWSEKYTKTDMVYLTKGSFWLVLSQAVTALLGLIVMTIFANTLTKEAFGQYRFIIAIVPILSLFTLQGTGPAIVRTISMGIPINIRSIIRTKIKWGILGSLISLLIAYYYFTQDNTFLWQIFALISFFVPFYDTFLIYIFYYRGLHKFKLSAVYEIASYLLQAVLMVSIVLITEDLLLLLTAFFLGPILARFFFYIRFRQKIGRNLEEPPHENTAEVVNYSKRLSVFGAFGVLAANSDKLLIWHIGGASALALYSIAFMFPKKATSLMTTTLSGILVPLFSKQENHVQTHHELIKKSLILGLILFLVFCIYVLAAHKVFTLLLPQYIEAVPLSVIAMLSLFITSPRAVIGSMFVATKSQVALLITAVANLVLTVTLIITGMYLYGVSGAVIGYVLKEFLVTGIQTLLLLPYSLTKQPTRY